jgi:hypothetical protein
MDKKQLALAVIISLIIGVNLVILFFLAWKLNHP